jgi:integrase
MGIYLRGKSWYFTFVHKRVRYAGSIGPVSRTLAKEEFTRKKAAAVENRLNPARAKKSPLFNDFADEFVNQKRSELRSTSLSRIEHSLKPLKRRFGLKRLNDITSFEIEKYRKDRKDAGKADATINRELQALRHMFNKAITWGKSSHNPMKQIKLRREENTRLRFLSSEEETKLLESCGESLRSIVIAALNTGFRRAELLSLTWQDVDFERGLVTVQAAYAKNRERRSIPMNRKLRALFEEQKTTGPKSSKIFLNRHGEAYKLATTVFSDAVRRACIENFHFHDLRHTFASRLVMRGVDLRTIQALMGHKTINMTLRYAHLAPDHLKRAVEVLDNENSHNNFHNTPQLPKTPRRSKLLKSQDWRRKVPGGAAGLQNQSGGRKAPGGFDSLPSPPEPRSG